MTPQEYNEKWMPFHRDLFGMKSNDDLPMFAAWFKSLSEFSVDELRAASLAMAEDVESSAKFRTQHLAELKLKIRAKRFERARSEFAEVNRQEARFDCQVCSSTGLVSVPHVRSVVDGAWAYPYCSMVVACRCNRGVATFNAVSAAGVKQRISTGNNAVMMMGLDEYEALHPDWRRLVHDHEKLMDAERNAEWYAQQGDKANPIKPANVREALARIGAVPKEKAKPQLMITPIAGQIGIDP